MKELQMYLPLIDSFQKRGWNAYKYGKTGFMPKNHKNRFDILLFHTNDYVPNPIALEVKPAVSCSDITKALDDQIRIRYLKAEFSCVSEGWEGIPPESAFCTLSGLTTCRIYTRNFPEASNFWVDRFAWRFGISVLYFWKSNFWLSWKNRYVNLDTGDITDPKSKDGNDFGGAIDFRGPDWEKEASSEKSEEELFHNYFGIK